MNVPMRKDPPEEVLTTADLAQSNRAAKEDGPKPVLAERRIREPEHITTSELRISPTPHRCFPIMNWRGCGMIGAPFRQPSSMNPAARSSKLTRLLHQR